MLMSVLFNVCVRNFTVNKLDISFIYNKYLNWSMLIDQTEIKQLAPERPPFQSKWMFDEIEKCVKCERPHKKQEPNRQMQENNGMDRIKWVDYIIDACQFSTSAQTHTNINRERKKAGGMGNRSEKVPAINFNFRMEKWWKTKSDNKNENKRSQSNQ